jgi:hypothetical protein
VDLFRLSIRLADPDPMEYALLAGDGSRLEADFASKRGKREALSIKVAGLCGQGLRGERIEKPDQAVEACVDLCDFVCPTLSRVIDKTDAALPPAEDGEGEGR